MERHPEPDPGQRRVVGDFELLREIGKGGVGVVWEARQLSLGRTVALKILPAIAGNETPLVVRFRREAAAAAAVKHPAIIEVHGFGHSELGWWIAMDLHETGSLSQRAEALRARGIAACVECIARVADALQHAHANGVVHRDVKPANILLRPDLSPVLTDFGLARQLGDPGISETGGFVGTPYYAAPEQVDGGAIDARTDVFALGVTLYELLTRKRPFDGSSSHEVLTRIRAHEPQDPRRHARNLPADLAAIVLKALEKEKALRYQTASAFAADLRAFLSFAPVSARRATWHLRLRKAILREPLKALLGVAVLLVLGIGGYLLVNLGELRAGERLDRERRVEQQLVDAMGLLLFAEPQAAHAACVRALALDPANEEALVCAVLAKLDSTRNVTKRGNVEAAQAELAKRSDGREKSRTLRRLERELEAFAAGTPQKGIMEPVETPLETFVAGWFAVERARRGDADGERVAGDLLRRATLASERPRLSTTLAFARCAHLLSHRDNAEDVAITLRTHWADRADAQHALGLVLSRYDVARSEAAYKKALEISPRWASAWHDYAVLLGQNGRLADARQAYERAIEYGPDRLRSLEFLAEVCFQLDDPAAAERHANEALEIDKRSDNATLVLCYLRLDRDDYDGAERLIDPVLARSPDLARAHAVKGSILAHKQDDDRALAELGRAIELDPSDGKPLAARSSLLLRQSRFEEAIADLRKLALMSPNNASVHANLGAALHQIGESDAAVRELQRALEIQPKRPDTHQNLVLLLRETGDTEGEGKALAAWRAACPDNVRVQFLSVEHLLVDPAADPARDLAAGLGWLERAVRLEPRAKRKALVARVHLLLWANRFAEAEGTVSDAKKALEEDDEFHAKLDRLLDDVRKAQRAAARGASRPQSAGTATTRGGAR